MSEWMPIETAPRDGTPILVYLEEPMLHSRVHAAVFHPKMKTIGCNFSFDCPAATHWKPQPEPPKEQTNDRTVS